MTVIAWDGKTLAADKMAGDAWIKRGTLTKIRRWAGAMVGCAGDAALCREMLAWLESGSNPTAFPESCRDRENAPTMLVIGINGQIVTYQHSPYPIEWDKGQPVAIGSGKEAALAVMELGYDARKAVEIASRICVGCGNGIDTLELK
jgi:ATP-dependent protease HslVU (ClpYQ) peptidase subunit